MGWWDGLQIVLTVLGFGVTLFQLRRTRAAVAATKQDVMRNQLLILVPQLQRVENDLERAVDGDERVLVRYQLEAWRWQASQLRGLVSSAISREHPIIRDLQESVSLASQAKIALTNTTKPIKAATRALRQSIAAVNDQCATLAAEVSSNPGER